MQGANTIRSFPVLVLLPALCAQVAIVDPAGEQIVAANAKVEVLARELQFCEGPVWLAAEQALVFSDVPAGKLMRWTAKDGVTAWQPTELGNGNTLDLDGRLLTCQHRARNVVRREADGKVTVLADRCGDQRFNSPNDVAVRGDGTIWFTDPTYGLGKGPKEQAGNFVYRLDPKSGALAVVQRDFDQPNGLCFAPDQQRLYVADSGRHQRVGAFEVAADGTLSAPLFWLDGGSDGMRCDERGNLYTTARGGVRVYSPAGKKLVEIEFDEIPTNCAFGGPEGRTLFVTARTQLCRIELLSAGAPVPPRPLAASAGPTRLDLAGDRSRQVVVDRQQGQYLGHVSTVLLEDGRTILAVYPQGHGKGAIVMKRSSDGGRTWSERLPTPASWATSREVPTIHRVVDAAGRKRLILWSGLHPARLAHSEDDGATWSELEPAGAWGGIVVMGDVAATTTKGRYLAWFHDDGRFLRPDGRKVAAFTLLQTESTDGGLHWSEPRALWTGSEVHLCEPGAVRSPDGRELLLLLRENARRQPSHAMRSRDEGASWSVPAPLHAALTGDRHTARHAPDGRLVIVFRDMGLAADHPTRGDFVAWVGRYDDLVRGAPGQYHVRLLDNQDSWDCGYPGLEVLPDGTFVATTYGHWDEGEAPYILGVRFTLADLDRMAAGGR